MASTYMFTYRIRTSPHHRHALVLLIFKLSPHLDLGYLSLSLNPITHLVSSLSDSCLISITSVVHGYLLPVIFQELSIDAWAEPICASSSEHTVFSQIQILHLEGEGQYLGNMGPSSPQLSVKYCYLISFQTNYESFSDSWKRAHYIALSLHLVFFSPIDSRQSKPHSRKSEQIRM